MLRYRSLRVAFLSTILIAGIGPARSADPVTGYVLGQVESHANNVVDHATRSGDFLLRRAAEEALRVIAGWKAANSELIGEAFSRLDDQTKSLFRNMDTELDRLEHDENVTMRDVERVSVQWSAALKNIPLVASHPELVNYWPRVVLPTGTDVVPLHVLGPRLPGASPSLQMAASGIPLSAVTDQEMLAKVSRSVIPFDNLKPVLVELPFTFQKSVSRFWNPLSWWQTEDVHRTLAVMAMPKVMAHVDIATKVKVDIMEKSTFNASPGGRGKDSDDRIGVAVPPDLLRDGWRIDMKALLTAKFDDNGGDGSGGSKCVGPDRNTFKPESFGFVVHFGSEGNGWGGRKDAHQNCRITVPIERHRTEIQDGPLIAKDLSWTDDWRTVLPDTIASYTISIRLFDGKSTIVTPTSPAPYGAVQVLQDRGELLFRSRPPQDF